jgi:DNA-directed RNA polymerase specialized sigma24 family protein
MAPSRRGKKGWELTPGAFRKLLSLLDSDPDRAAQEYESIRLRLIEFFRIRRCDAPEEHADETLDRAARRISEGAVVHTKPSSYFHGIARKVFQESTRKPPPQPPPPPPPDPDEIERKHECMRQCLARLDTATRELLTEYYQADSRARLRMAERTGVSINTLKIRIHRLRQGRLHACLKRCLEKAAGREII